MNVRIDDPSGSKSGDIHIELYPDKAPITVENFKSYVASGFYNDTIFHRVIDGFMIQGGGFQTGMKRKTTKAEIKNEANNGLSNDTYTVAMARTNEPHSASSQFFINVNNNTFLNYKNEQDYGYAVFGKVVKGQELVDLIKVIPTTRKGYFSDVPEYPVTVTRIRIVDGAQ
ncbi:MAG: peptidylprolyl isomerase [bacterium]|nr:peptidylprolyl isomerase [bacterium]